MIFTSTTGRSGTRYLANIINKNALNVTAEHDPYPQGYGAPIRWYDNGEVEKLRFLALKKFKRLKREIRYRFILNMPVAREMTGRKRTHLKIFVPFQKKLGNYFPSVEIKEIYLESTHAFIKSFGEAMYNLVSDISLIHLTRNPLEVAKSFLNRDSIPGPYNKYLLDPNFKRNEIKLKMRMTDFQKCLWYWFETEVRHVTFLEKHNINKIYEIDIEELNDKQKVAEMFKTFGITYDHLFFDVDRNKNKKPTELTEQDLKEARELIEVIPDWVFDKIGNTYRVEKMI